MILTELFDHTVPFEFERYNQASFTINENRYLVDFLPVEEPNTTEADIEVLFSLDNRGQPPRHTITNTGNQFAVFSTVLATIKAYVIKWQPDTIRFSADFSEPSRVSLYDRMVRQLANGWDIKSSPHGMGKQYLLTNPKRQ